MKNPSMKTFVGLAMLAALVGCDSNSKPATAEPVAQAPLTAPPESVQPVVAGLATPLSEEVSSLVIGGNCNLDAVNGNQLSDGRLEIKRGVPVVVGGWVADSSGAVPSDAMLVIHSESARYATQLATGIARSDVATAMKNAALANAGFESPLALSDVPAGSYDLSVLMNGSERHRCPLNIVVSVVD